MVSICPTLLGGFLFNSFKFASNSLICFVFNSQSSHKILSLQFLQFLVFEGILTPDSKFFPT